MTLQRLIIVAFIVLAAAPAQADNQALADSLFDEGRQLMKDGEYAKACKKFEGSLELVDRLGVQLNLADCYEKLGKTASAWSQFRSARGKAQKAGDTGREDYAAQHIKDLEPTLARMTIELSEGAEIEGLAVTLDGNVVPSAAFGTAAPVDPGTHILEATAPGHMSWSSKVSVEEADAISVEVPVLGQETAYRKDEDGGGGGFVDTGAGRGGGRTRRLVGLSVGGAGVVALGVGLAFGMSASSKWDDALGGTCNDDGVCADPADVQLVEDARSAAMISTIAVSVGVAAIAGGAILYFTAPKDRPRSEASYLAPSVGAGSIGVTLGGTF